MSQRFEIWIIDKKWMTVNENTKKKEEKKYEKEERKIKKTKKAETKNKRTEQQSLNKLFNNAMYK